MRTLILFIVTSSCFFLAGCDSRATEKNSPDMTAEQIVQKYTEAIGGYDQLKSIQTLSKKGFYVEPAYEIVWKARIQRKRPNFRVIGVGPTNDANFITEGFSGVAWEHQQGKEVVYSEGEAKKVILVSNEFDHPFIDARIKGHQLKYKGLKWLGSTKTHDLEVTIDVMNEKYRANFYFDVNSYLLLGKRKTMPIHAVGDEVDIVVYYSDYREVAGVLMPYNYIERNEKTGAFLNANIWEEVVANVDLPDSTFQPPASMDE